MTPLLKEVFPGFSASGHLQEEAKVFANGLGIQSDVELIESDTWMYRAMSKNGIQIDLPAANAWLQENADIHRRYSSTLNAQPGYHDFISLHAGRDFKQIENNLKQQTNLLLPHIRQALLINRPFSILQERYNAVLQVLDKFRLGVLIIDHSLSILLKNQSADDMLSSVDGMSDRNHQLAIQDSQDRVKLREAINTVSAKPSGTVSISVERNSNCLPYLCQLSRIDLSQEGAIRTKFLVIVIDPERAEIVDLEGLSKIFNLTKREADVAKGVVAGCSNKEIGEQIDVSAETVKTHVKSIAQKTRCSSRVEIVRLAHNISLPID